MIMPENFNKNLEQKRSPPPQIKEKKKKRGAPPLPHKKIK